MPIVPLPVFEADADPHQRSALTDEEVLARLEPPTSMVVRFGAMGLIGEYPCRLDVTPGCGSKVVARTHRGTELGEMLTTTCPNSGCGKSVSRKEMRAYIDASGGKDYPFHDQGRVLRIATIEDLNAHSALQDEKRSIVTTCKQHIARAELEMKLIDVELILGGEMITVYYESEQRVDFRELVRDLAAELRTRVEMRQIGARDEARLTADYERCGQHCCCKSFLKVLKPVSMGAAKMQKATLDPLKISGRCGRLMCCLRYEDQTYRELKAKLPHRKSRVGTAEGVGIVMETRTLVQLVLVRLEHDGREIAVPVEELIDPDRAPTPEEIAARDDPMRGMSTGAAKSRSAKGDTPPERRGRRRRGGRRGKGGDETAGNATSEASSATPRREREGDGDDGAPKKKRRRRGRGGRGRRSGGTEGGAGRESGGDGGSSSSSGGSDGAPKKKRRRRRRRRGGDGGGEREG